MQSQPSPKSGRETERDVASDALRSLDHALEGERMLPLVARAVGLGPSELAGLRCSPVVLNHKPGRRCTLRYTLVRWPPSAEGEALPAVVAKLYRSRRQAMRTYARMDALRSAPPGGAGVPCIPACLGPVRTLGLFFQQCVDGTELDHVIASARSQAPLVLAAQWLAQLHASAPLTELPEMSVDLVLRKVADWSAEIAADSAPALVASLRRTCDALHRSAAGMPRHATSMIHRDFYHAQVLWNGERIWVLDFDELSTGDPALDVGHFLAHLEYKAWLWTEQRQAFRDAAAAFAAAYRAAAGSHAERRLPFYATYTFLKLAHTEVRRRRADWKTRTELLVRLAGRQLEDPRSVLGGPARRETSLHADRP